MGRCLDGSGSPHRAQSGGVNRGTVRQHDVQIGPWVGASRAEAQTAQHGASSTVRSASTAERAVGVRVPLDLHPFSAAPEPFERVEISGFAREDMNEAVEAVDQHPVCSDAFDMRRSTSDLLETRFDTLRN